MAKKYKAGGDYLSSSKEVTFGKPRRKAQSGNSPVKSNKGLLQATKKGGVPAYRMPNGKVVIKGSAEYLVADSTYKEQTPKRNAWKKYRDSDEYKASQEKEEVSPREQKQNQPQGSGAKDESGEVKDVADRRTGKSGSDAESKTTVEKTKKPVEKKDPYAEAKKKDPKLDTWIKQRNNSKKGSDEYIMAQNKINKAYGKGPQRQITVKKLEGKKPTEIKSAVSPAKKIGPAPTPKPTPKSNTGAGSGMGGVQAEKDKIADLKSTPPPSATPDRRAKRKGRQAARKTKRAAIKTAKGALKTARKMESGGKKKAQAGLISKAAKGVLKGGIASGLLSNPKTAVESVNIPVAPVTSASKKVRSKMTDAEIARMKEAVKPSIRRSGGKKKAQFGAMLGAIGGAKGAQGGFGKKLLGAAKGAIGGGIGGRIFGAGKALVQGEGLKGAVQGFKGGAFGNSNPMGGGGQQDPQVGQTTTTEPQQIARRGGKKRKKAQAGLAPGAALKRTAFAGRAKAKAKPSWVETASGKDIKKMARGFKRSGRKAIRKGDEAMGAEFKRIGSNLKTKGRAKKKVERAAKVAARVDRRKARQTVRKISRG